MYANYSEWTLTFESHEVVICIVVNTNRKRIKSAIQSLKILIKSKEKKRNQQKKIETETNLINLIDAYY